MAASSPTAIAQSCLLSEVRMVSLIISKARPANMDCNAWGHASQRSSHSLWFWRLLIALPFCFAQSLGLGGSSRQWRGAPTQIRVRSHMMLFGGNHAKRLRCRPFFCFALRFGLGGSSPQWRAAPKQNAGSVAVNSFRWKSCQALSAMTIFLFRFAFRFRRQFPAMARRTNAKSGFGCI